MFPTKNDLEFNNNSIKYQKAFTNKLETAHRLPIFSTAFWPTYLAGGGRIFLILWVKQCITLKYRQLLRSRKKLGPIPPKLGPYRGNENFRQNVKNRDSAQKACFQEF